MVCKVVSVLYGFDLLQAAVHMTMLCKGIPRRLHGVYMGPMGI